MTEIEAALDKAKRAVAELMELSDACRIFLSIHDGATGTTSHLSFGSGNWYAQESQIREWVLQQEERARAETHND